MKTLMLTVFLGCAAAIAFGAEQAPAAGQEQAIRAVVREYLHGLQFNDVASLQRAFWPGASLFWVKKTGELGQLGQADWYKGFAASAGKEEAGDLRIVSVDVSGDAASVKVQEDYEKSRYIDYLSLLKIGGGWKIVAKIYTVSPR